MRTVRGIALRRVHKEPVHAARAAAPMNNTMLPDPFQLGQAEKERLEKVLGFWEQRSSQVKTYSCKFKRWDYNSVFGPKDPNAAAAIYDGTIRYASPDKGEFHVNTIAKYQAGKNGGPPQFIPERAEHEEHWICDGRSVFELNGKTKQLIEERLPPDMKGNAIADGPLPFMFGAKKEKLMARYWLRELQPPENSKGQYWIEARPKTRGDAANFQRVTVILDEKEFLPMAMQIFPPGWNGRQNWTRQTYRFDDRKVNDPLQRGQDWLGQFISPQLPRGWKRVVNNFGVPQQNRPVRTATPPAAQPR